MKFRDKTEEYNVQHGAISMSVLAQCLGSLSVNPLRGIFANLISTQVSSINQSPQLHLGEFLPPPELDQRLARMKENFEPIGSALRPHELPLLAIMCRYVFRKVQDSLRLILTYFNLDVDTMSTKLASTAFYLNGAYEFLSFAKNILYAVSTSNIYACVL